MGQNKINIIASFFSALTIITIPMIGSLLIMNSNIAENSLNDDAPFRAAGIFLYGLLPFVYVLLVACVFVSTLLLEKYKLLSLKKLIIFVLFVSISFGLYFGFQSPFGNKDQFIGFIVFTSFFSICLVLGAVVWWLIAKSKHKNPINLTSKDSAL